MPQSTQACCSEKSRRLAADHLDPHQPLGEAQGNLQGVGQAGADFRLDHQPVDHHLDGVLLFLVELGGLGQLVDLAVDAHAHETVGLQLAQLLAVFPLAAADDGGQQQQPGLFRPGEDLVDHLLDGLAGDLLAALVAVDATDAGEEQAQVVVDLGDGADRGARVPGGGLLLDGDRRREPLDTLHVRLVHLLQELAGVGGEGFDVAALPLGVDRVEGKGALPRAGDAGDHHQLVAGDLDIDALEVVLAGTLDDDLVGHS